MEYRDIDLNSVENQRIKGKFVSREVKACFSYEMDEILRAGEMLEQTGSNKLLLDYEDIENLYYFPWEDVIYDILEDFDGRAEEYLEYANNPDTFNRKCQSKGDFEVFLKSLDSDELRELAEEFDIECDELPQEIFEWWIISEFLYRKLKEKGEPVLEWGNNYYWGRTTTGQAILLDRVISEICFDMGILEGQKYSWAEKRAKSQEVRNDW